MAKGKKNGEISPGTGDKLATKVLELEKAQFSTAFLTNLP